MWEKFTAVWVWKFENSISQLDNLSLNVTIAATLYIAQVKVPAHVELMKSLINQVHGRLSDSLFVDYYIITLLSNLVDDCRRILYLAIHYFSKKFSSCIQQLRTDLDLFWKNEWQVKSNKITLAMFELYTNAAQLPNNILHNYWKDIFGASDKGWPAARTD